MRNIRLLLEYDGTDFHGWQRQPDVRTVQGAMETAVRNTFGQRTEVIGAGRTDRGVHAQGYVCNFHVDTDLEPERIVAALRAHLDKDVVVKKAIDAPPDFHARFDAVSRCYVYRLDTVPTAIHRRIHHVIKYQLDVSAMDRAACLLRGEHDFTSFTRSGSAADPTCQVLDTSVTAEGPGVSITVEANRFLHNMVRIIAGTLIDVGRGRMDPEQITEVLCRKDRTAAGPTAPPCGLVLVAVRYPGEG